MAYSFVFSKELEQSLKKLYKKDHLLFKRVKKKIKEIIIQPEHYKPLKNKLKGFRRAHIGHFVLVYTIQKETVYFISLDHHDKAY